MFLKRLHWVLHSPPGRTCNLISVSLTRLPAWTQGLVTKRATISTTNVSLKVPAAVTRCTVLAIMHRIWRGMRIQWWNLRSRTRALRWTTNFREPVEGMVHPISLALFPCSLTRKMSLASMSLCRLQRRAAIRVATRVATGAATEAATGVATGVATTGAAAGGATVTGGTVTGRQGGIVTAVARALARALLVIAVVRCLMPRCLTCP
mmetsp:Transcript_88911/g.144035  ORF Transcript_88911/g.144035 Transcript_88911/m.144035 type:complete len:207 (+) Transcript_88911:233-853(+)